MKLCKQTIDVIKRISDVGKIVNIGVFVIDKTGIRAKAEESYIFLFQHDTFDFLEFDSICINRVSEFSNRLNFIEKVSGSKGYDIQLAQTKVLDSGETIAQKLQLITTGTAVEIGCASAAKYSFPRTINDESFVSFSITSDSIETLNGFSRVIHSKDKFINIKGIDGMIVATTEDTVGDSATHILSSSPTFISEKRDFNFVYSTSNLLPLLRGRMDVTITLTNRGVLITDINDIQIVMLPEKMSG